MCPTPDPTYSMKSQGVVFQTQGRFLRKGTSHLTGNSGKCHLQQTIQDSDLASSGGCGWICILSFVVSRYMQEAGPWWFSTPKAVMWSDLCFISSKSVHVDFKQVSSQVHATHSVTDTGLTSMMI